MGIESEQKPNNGSSGLDVFQETLDKSDINYRIVGSIAMDSYCNNNKRNSSQNADLDLLVSRPDYIKLKSPSLINQLTSGGRVKYDSSISKYIDFRPNEDYSFLVFRDMRMSVRSELFEPRANLLTNQEIKTIPAITLFHTFSVCGGILRPKDWEKILQLGRYVRNNPDVKFSEKDITQKFKIY